MTKDRLYFHSPAHMGTVFLHTSPVLVVWKMRWEEFGGDFSAKEVLWMNMRYTIPIYLVWLTCYYVFIFLVKRKKVYSDEYSSVFKDHRTNSKSPMYQYFGNNKMLNEFIFVGSHLCMSSVFILVSSYLYVSPALSTILPILTVVSTVWNSSDKFCKALNNLSKN